eukprot:366009-Chlamydomonas_euryale.AAC.13
MRLPPDAERAHAGSGSQSMPVDPHKGTRDEVTKTSMCARMHARMHACVPACLPACQHAFHLFAAMLTHDLMCRKLSSSVNKLVLSPCLLRKLLSSVLPTPPACRVSMQQTDGMQTMHNATSTIAWMPPPSYQSDEVIQHIKQNLLNAHRR